MTEEKKTTIDKDDPPLCIPEDVRYNCSCCGRCCSGWSIGMTAADYENVKNVDWGEVHTSLKDKELVIDRRVEYEKGGTLYPYFTKPREDGVCSFLVDNLCIIHGHLGEPKKPTICQIFPYSFVETPTGVYMSVGYDSMAAVGNKGELLTDQREMLEGIWNKTVKHLTAQTISAAQRSTATDTISQSGEKKHPFAEVTLSGETIVPWEEYLFLDNRLVKLLKDAPGEKKPFIQAIIDGEEIVLEAIRLAKKGESLSKLADFEPSVSIKADAQPTGVNQSTIALLYNLYLVYPAIRSSYQDLWQLPRSKLLTPKYFSRMVGQYSQYAGSLFRSIVIKKPAIPQLGENDIRKTLAHPMTGLSEELNEFFCRWLYVKIFGKTYFGPVAANYSVLSGYNSLIACFLCAILYAKSQAMANNRGEIDIADLYEVYFRLDREFQTFGQVIPQVSTALSFAYSIPRLLTPLLEALHGSFKS